MTQQTPPNPMSTPSPTTLTSTALPLSSQILDFSHDKLHAEQQHDELHHVVVPREVYASISNSSFMQFNLN
ncbi:unnamed protein product [Didymodactylos carnosus]|uniref:Uncharacterized protein n=1 Tax=Didymodactylos carnosus TaxID=1234261 RepID=A0A815ZY64_9BILA|nr:unnamed protein product [Didymodactylos carnosus]CAF1588057.1 unnamed protein product [Didymodactylos carnosus]CAF4154956.1 unnamed protein product [Didymodactylos carnosus]CAF4458812.1 unnamed protein product [Didymodactylos carnosus]